jgi:redox-sensitive bicupin YhaK (pirin superfamily)
VIEILFDSRLHDLGAGFSVGRVLPYRHKRMVGPFVFLDHMLPMDIPPGAPQNLDVRPHPHIGLSTVTYLFSGQLTHRDSLGYQQEIRPGEVNWMVAGRGITHSERFEYAREHGAHFHGLQAWIALPLEHEETDPSFVHYNNSALVDWQEPGIQGRLIAGEFDGMAAKTKVHSPMVYAHLDFSRGAQRTLRETRAEQAVYVVSGSLKVDDAELSRGQMAVITPNTISRIQAETDATVMLLGGEPIGERYLLWNFVSSSRERLEAAADDWRNGRMKLPPGDEHEFVPLPKA